MTAGTLFEGARIGLRTWFAAVWYVVNQTNGVSAPGLQRVLGFGSYETARLWLHKLRRAMVPTTGKLRGEVEVDESFVGGHEQGVHGRETRNVRKLGYHHVAHNVSKSGKRAHELLPVWHRVSALVKRWLLGTHQGSVKPEQLDHYRGEFTFRFNRRYARHRGLLPAARTGSRDPTALVRRAAHRQSRSPPAA